MEVVVDVLRFLHSWTRWLFVGIAAVAVVYYLARLAARQDYDVLSARLITAFSSLVGVQWGIGLLFVGALGSMTGFGVRHYWEHLTVMTVALVVAHLHFMWRRKALNARTRYGRYLGLIAGVMVLIVVGIATLPPGIQWRFYPASPS